VTQRFEFNRIGTPAWFLNGRLLRRRTFGLFQIWLLERLTPVFRLVDSVLPFPGLSIVAVLERRDGVAASERVQTGVRRVPDPSPASPTPVNVVS
jgi:hypothetical protein